MKWVKAELRSERSVLAGRVRVLRDSVTTRAGREHPVICCDLEGDRFPAVATSTGGLSSSYNRIMAWHADEDNAPFKRRL